MPFKQSMIVQDCLKHHVVVVHLVLKGCSIRVTKTEFPYVLDENLQVDIFKLPVDFYFSDGESIR